MKKIIIIAFTISILILSACGSSSTPIPSTPTPNVTNPPVATVTPKNATFIEFVAGTESNDISLVQDVADGKYESISQEGKDAIVTKGFATEGLPLTSYLYFAVNDEFLRDKAVPLSMEIEYFDDGTTPIVLNYDSTQESYNKYYSPANKPITLAYRTNTKTWKVAHCSLPDALFANRQNGGGDFRIFSFDMPVSIHRIKISRGITAVPLATSQTPTVLSPAEYPQPLGERAIFTYYFYWYDSTTGFHMDNLLNAPADFQTMSFRDVNWHKKQLKDIAYAGIDTILPVDWYDDGNFWWSRAGLEVLAQSLELVRQEGITPPSVGPFLDTTSSNGKNFNLENEQAYLYDQIRYFFTTIPRPYWALTEDNRPIIWMFTSNWPSAYDQTFIDYIYKHFEEDFDVRPYLVFESSWGHPAETVNGQVVIKTNEPRLQYDANYMWIGGNAPWSTAQVTSIIPGYDDHISWASMGNPYYIYRNNGETYRNGFVAAICRSAPWVAIETWNELHEGTDIAESIQYGREYIEITHEYSSYFKNGELPERARAQSEYYDAIEVSTILGENDQEAGIALIRNYGDGQQMSITIGGISARQTVPVSPDALGSSLYFAVDNGFYFDTPQPVEMTVTYFDDGYESIYVEYDAAKCGISSDISTMYKQKFVVQRRNTQTWKTVTIKVYDATFTGHQNFGADFRLDTGQTPLTVSKVILRKIP